MINIEGLAHICYSHNNLYLCIAWIVIMLTSSCLCVMLIFKSVADFLRYDVTVKKRFVHEHRPLFPIVTLCPMYPFATDLSLSLLNQASVEITSAPSKMMLSLEKYARNRSGSYLDDSTKSQFIDLESMLLSCRIGKIECMFRRIWHPFFFNCYRFNTGLDSDGNQIDRMRVDIAGASFKLGKFVF